MNQILVFSHIPKTAGTTVNYLLKGNFGHHLLAAKHRKGADRVAYRYKDLKNDLKLYPNVKCIVGHCMKPFIDFKDYEHHFKWFTILRNPQARFISHYIHQQANPDGQYNMDIISWAEKFNRGNWMVKMIAGEEDVEAAKQILKEKFSFIGFTEHLYESLALLKQKLDLDDFQIVRTTPKMKSKDANLKKALYDQIDRYKEFIQEINALDFELYDHFYALFKKNAIDPFDTVPSLDSPLKLHFQKNILSYKIKNNLLYKPSVKLLSGE